MKIKENKPSYLYPDPKLPPVKEDLRKTFRWNISKITSELVSGFKFISDFKKAVTVFGSTSFSEDNPYYQEARKMGSILAKKGYTVVTGGGPGIMEAANRGAFEAEGESVGMNIQLPEGQRINKYVTKPIGFYHFFTRKAMMSFSSNGYVFFPGGFGTLEEFFEMITLVQTKKLAKPVPVVAVGKDYWVPLFKWLESEVYMKRKAVKEQDLKIIQIVDTAEEAMERIEKFKYLKFN
ncbi:MAG: TIGR00730 family Rossman fold protein [Candidatus Staskawiczbacteria bacterium]|nr:TIGR00730 family Rossman fold protein [Candidatus Staskawiczbacteria bacterium]